MLNRLEHYARDFHGVSNSNCSANRRVIGQPRYTMAGQAVVCDKERD